MRRVVLRLPTCAFPPKSSSYKISLHLQQPGLHCSPRSHRHQHLAHRHRPRPHLLPRLRHPSRLGDPNRPALKDITALAFAYSGLAVFVLALLASFLYLALRCLEPPSPT